MTSSSGIVHRASEGVSDPGSLTSEACRIFGAVVVDGDAFLPTEERVAKVLKAMTLSSELTDIVEAKTRPENEGVFWAEVSSFEFRTSEKAGRYGVARITDEYGRLSVVFSRGYIGLSDLDIQGKVCLFRYQRKGTLFLIKKCKGLW